MKAFRLIFLVSLSASAKLSFANIIGSDLQNFNATSNGLDFVTVQSSETLGRGIFNIGLFSTYAVNTLPRYEDAEGRDSRIKDTISTGDVNFGMGLTSFWDVGVSFPTVLSQDVRFNGDRGQFDRTGLTEVRANTKWRLMGDRDSGVAFIFSTNFNMTNNNPYIGRGAGPTYNFEMAFDTTLSKIALGANLGYRKRSIGTQIAGFPIEPLTDQLIASIAASYLLARYDTKMIFEAYAGIPREKTKTAEARSSSAAESLFGLKHDVDDNLALHLGMGTELGNGTASADWRLYAGLNYVFGFEEEKKTPRLALPKAKKPKTKASLPPPAPPKFMDTIEPGPPEPAGEGDEVFVLRGINFAFDSSSRVLPGTRDILVQLAQHLRKTGFEKLLIEGHTDSVGNEQYNYRLGLDRAQMIREYLVRVEKFDSASIEAISFGEQRPVADNGNYQGRQLNRRVVFRLTYKK